MRRRGLNVLLVAFGALSFTQAVWAEAPVCLFEGKSGEQSGHKIYQATCLQKEESAFIFFSKTQNYLRLQSKAGCEKCSTDYAVESQDQCEAILFYFNRQKDAVRFQDQDKNLTLRMTEKPDGPKIPYIRVSSGFFSDTVSVGTTDLECNPELPYTQVSLGTLHQRVTDAKEKRAQASIASKKDLEEGWDGTPPVAMPSTLRAPERTPQTQKAKKLKDSTVEAVVGTQQFLQDAYDSRYGEDLKN